MREKLYEAVEELLAWWDSETDEFRHFVLSILAALPGGDKAAELVRPAPVGWKEIDLLDDLLSALENADDVRFVVRALLREKGGEQCLAYARL